MYAMHAGAKVHAIIAVVTNVRKGRSGEDTGENKECLKQCKKVKNLD